VTASRLRTTRSYPCVCSERHSPSNFRSPTSCVQRLTSRASRATSHGSRPPAHAANPPSNYTLRKSHQSRVFGAKPFRIHSYEKRACNSFRIHSYKNAGLKVPVESYSYKKHRGGEGGGTAILGCARTFRVASDASPPLNFDFRPPTVDLPFLRCTPFVFRAFAGQLPPLTLVS
jgi:hypothetical protein